MIDLNALASRLEAIYEDLVFEDSYQEVVEVVAALRQHADALARDAWVPVGERLPDFDVPVWMLIDGRILTGARCDDADGWLWGRIYGSVHYCGDKWQADDCETDDDYQPTHWRQLPEAPKVGVVGGNDG